jgi:hypothetical protein
MDELPQEIIDNIVSFVPQRVGVSWVIDCHGRDMRPSLLSPLATLSRKFQRAVEKCTFKSLWIEVSNPQLDEFERIVSAERWANVLHLKAQLVLVVPPLPVDIFTAHGGLGTFGPESNEDGMLRFGPEYETMSVRQADKEASTALLRRLWDRIATLSRQLGHDEANLGLELINDFTIRPVHHPAFRDRNTAYGFSLQDLTDDIKDFPILHQVHGFTFANMARYWNPRVGAILASKMPNLKSTLWLLSECPPQWGRYYSLDKQYRDGLVEGAAVVGTLPHKLRKFNCRLKHPAYDCPQQLPRFVNNGSVLDPVSCALRRLTKDCEEITLKGSFMPCLFDPPPSPTSTETAAGEQQGEEEPVWQRTRILHVIMELGRPDGIWHFSPGENEINVPDALLDCRQLPPGYRTSPATFNIGGHKYEVDVEKNDYDYLIEDMHMVAPLRFFPRPVFLPSPTIDDDESGTLSALLVAFARCCARMPALEIAILEVRAHEIRLYQPDFDLDVDYESNHESDYGSDDGSNYVSDYGSDYDSDIERSNDFYDGHPFEVVCLPAGYHLCRWPADEAADSSRTRVYLHGKG